MLTEVEVERFFLLGWPIKLEGSVLNLNIKYGRRKKACTLYK